MKQHRLALLHPVWPAAMLFAVLIVALSMTSAQARPDEPQLLDAPGGIEGHLYDPASMPVNNGWIEIIDVMGQAWMGTATAPDGFFSIPNLPANRYTLHAYPPANSPFAPSVPTDAQVLSGQWTQAELLLTELQVGGYVRDCAEVPERRIEGAQVVGWSNDASVRVWDTTNISGEFKLGGMVAGPMFTLQAFPPPGTEYLASPNYTVTGVITGVMLELCIPPVNVTGAIQNPQGEPVAGAWVTVWNDSFEAETSSDISGTFRLRGVPAPGTYWLHAGPPWHSRGLITHPPFTITVDPPPSITDAGVITLPLAFKTVLGRVVLAGANGGAPGAEVHAWQVDGVGFASGGTDRTGVFTLSVTGGEWYVGVNAEPTSGWIYPGPPTWVFFEPNTLPETRTLALEVVPTDAWVQGQIWCPGGPGPVPCSDPSFDLGPEDIWVELTSDKLGNSGGLDPFYRFGIPVPNGWYKLLVHVQHPWLQGPEPMPVFVGPGGSSDVGAVVLWFKDARITGRVVNEFGDGVEGVTIAGWQPEGVGWGWASTDASGVYTMPVIGGEWLVEPQPAPELPFVFRDRPRTVFVEPFGELRGVDFQVNWAAARIQGFAVNARDSERLWTLDGWARAERWIASDQTEFFSDGPLTNGAFDLKVGGDETYFVGLDLPPEAAFVSGSSGPVTIGPGEWVTEVVVPLERKDALISGRLLTTMTPPLPASGAWGKVFGEDTRGNWASSGVNPDTAGYVMAVVSGTWRLRAWVDPASGFVAAPQPMTVTVGAGRAAVLNIPVWPIEATLSGRVLDPSGVPLSRTVVFAAGESPFVGYFEAYAESDAFGYFELGVPAGGYTVGAGLPGDELEARGWLNPPPIEVPWASAGSPATGLELQFRRLDSWITGRVGFASGGVVPSHLAYVWAWAESGEWAETKAGIISGTEAFTYVLPVISGTIWHVGAVYDDWDNGEFYESAEEVVDLTGSSSATRDLVLGGPYPLPQPFIVSFDGGQVQTILMPDGVELRIPAQALVDSGMVTLFILPTQALRPEKGRTVVGAGYEIWAVGEDGQKITQFDKNVVMSFSYPPDAELEPLGVSEYELVPVYYSTEVGRWILAASYVVDTLNNRITLQLDHFTKFGALSMARGTSVYLPVVLR